MVLFFHHQERIIPGWLDKKIIQRVPDAQTLSNVVMVFPSQSFIENLPGGKVPDRDDFLTYIDDQATSELKTGTKRWNYPRHWAKIFWNWSKVARFGIWWRKCKASGVKGQVFLLPTPHA